MRTPAPRVALQLLGSLAVLALAGCRTAPAPGPIIGPGADAPWGLQREALARVDRYSLDGRVAVAANGEGFSGNLRYQQQQQKASLAIEGPMGLGGVRVSMDGDAVTIATSKGDTLDGAAARAELEQRLGFVLPLNELRWWLLGLPAPGEFFPEMDAVTGEYRGFRQNGWHLSIDGRAPAMGFALPKRLTATRDGARMKLLVDRWQ